MLDTIDNSTILLSKEEGNWNLFVQPLGDSSNGTLEKTFNYPRELNGNNEGAFYNCTASFVENLDPDLYSIKEECGDYIYFKDEQVSLNGKRFNQIRNHINFFKKHYNYTVRPYSTEDYNECFELFNGWKAKKEGNIPIKDEHIAQLFQNLCLFPDMFGITIRVDGKIVGFSLGGLLAQNEAICIIRKTDRQYNGLSEFIDNEFYKYVPENVNLVNDGDDLNSESLRNYKMKWHPAQIRKYYTVQQVNC
ncbi:MAG: phosphatidylglycerol lysyltransferase domain-containing protein [ANME-2 cluster archaeon]|nr:phosphatidylglycerol lysyltransferase domain-containing protein [ANME-2 cluster archaeon]